MKHFLQEQAADGSGVDAATGGGLPSAGTGAGVGGTGSDGKNAGGSAGSAAGNGASPGSGAAGAGQQLSLLAQATAGASPPGAAAANGAIKEGDAAAGKVTRDASVPAWVPEKFKTGEDLAKAYGELEARMKSSGLPPKAADDYTWTPPADFPLDADKSKAFKSWALEQGFTQKQYEGLMGKYVENASGMVVEAINYDFIKSAAELRKVPGWESDADYYANLGHASKALHAAFSPNEVALFEVRNDPMVWRLASYFGKQLKEDGGMSAGTTLQAGETTESLMAMPAYLESLKTGVHTPESQMITRKIAALRERKIS